MFAGVGGIINTNTYNLPTHLDNNKIPRQLTYEPIYCLRGNS